MEEKHYLCPDEESLFGFRKITYVEWNRKNQDRVLFCVHGLTRNAYDFAYLAGDLQDTYRVIAVNLAGHGMSDPFEDASRYVHRSFVEDIIALLQHLGIEKVDWIGSSLGGVIALYLLESCPGLIQKLVLNDIGPIVSGSAIPPSVLNLSVPFLEEQYSLKTQDACQERLLALLAGYRLTQQEQVSHMIKYGIIQDASGIYRLAFDPKALMLFVNTHDVARSVKLWNIWSFRVRIPVLELWGSESTFMNDAIVQTMALASVDLTTCRCDGCGHVCHLMDEKQVQFVRHWLLGQLAKKKYVLDCVGF